MKPLPATIVILVLFGAGAAGGYYYLNRDRATPAPAATDPVGVEASEHGTRLDVPDGSPICPEHHVPELICPFCNPSLVEELGWCGGHDVAEALCTRCNPTLIAAFKAESDWCAEHGLPESQCLLCNPKTDP